MELSDEDGAAIGRAIVEVIEPPITRLIGLVAHLVVCVDQLTTIVERQLRANGEAVVTGAGASAAVGDVTATGETRP